MSRVLVVDDEHDMRWLLRGVLRDQGFEVVAAEDGRAALEQITREPPDVVLLDIKMPRLSGIQVLEKAKAVDPWMAVVMITAHGDLPSAVQAMQLGAYDYLTKPFDNDNILSTVRRALEKREMETARLKAAKVATLLETALALNHEINNPLAAILGHAQLLEKELRGAKATKRVKVIIESCDRIAGVVRRLSSIVEPVTTIHQGVGPVLDLDRSGAACERPTENGVEGQTERR